MRAERGELVTGDLACAVISLRNQPGLVDAVRSLLEQRPRPEIVVVNSGGGDPEATLRAAGLDVPVVNRPGRLYAGAARNAGIAATRAPFVAFLAADCVAEPGWVAERLRLHRAGAAAVASVVTNPFPRSRSANTSYLLRFWRRMADTAEDSRVRSGVSYDRRIFERFGSFREDLRTYEDREFNARISRHVEIVWSAHVRTAHGHPTRPGALLLDGFARGWRAARVDLVLYGGTPTTTLVARNAVNLRHAWRHARDTPDPVERRRRLRAWPLMPAAFAYAMGVIAARSDPRRLFASRRPSAETPTAVAPGFARSGSGTRPPE